MNAPLLSDWPVPASVAPDRLAEIQAEFSNDWLRVAADARQGMLEAPRDRRFAAAAWAANPGSLLTAHAYLLSEKALHQMVDAANLTEKARDRLRFSVMQWLAAVSPSNFFATNPDAQQALLETRGESLRHGVHNLLDDLQKQRLSQTDESQFEVGRNLAVTPGSVIFQNPLMQVIQYAPLGPRVRQTPLLVVPPCINKYYILDLQPANSFVRYAVECGFTVFLVSWRNPLASDADGLDTATWDDYLQDGVLAALRVASEISGREQINALGFCVGGTMLASALSLAHAQGKKPVKALTLLTTLLDFRDTGVLDVFVDELHVGAREQQMGRGGLMSARELGTTFSFLRPNELVWNYVVANYLKGRTPPALDFLFWNADGTNLPGPFFSWYFRNAYLENNLAVPGRVRVQGHALDLSSLSMPAYIFGSREDHIVPWRSAYASTGILRGPRRFVLGASGHVAGVINPPAAKRRHYWTCQAASDESGVPGDPDAWLGRATQHDGSWWPDWAGWLVSHSGPLVRARSTPGDRRHKPIEAAPGRYVKVRAV